MIANFPLPFDQARSVKVLDMVTVCGRSQNVVRSPDCIGLPSSRDLQFLQRLKFIASTQFLCTRYKSKKNFIITFINLLDFCRIPGTVQYLPLKFSGI